MPTSSTAETGALLNRMRYQADPLADATVSHILGPWNPVPDSADADALLLANAAHWQRLAVVSRLFEKWQDNRSLNGWKAGGKNTEPEVAELLEAYVQTAQSLPAWACQAKIERAETLFMDYGVLSCTLLFCSSLPECYMVPDLASVLHVSGQLEAHTEHRIRTTAAMIFPVMMKGGLTAPDGSGIAQILKVRLIHATIRNLILHGNPEELLRFLDAGPRVEGAGLVPALAGMRASANMHQALYAHGWDLAKNGVPCNQEELAYTLLTFGYVFLRSLRRLGLGLDSADEQAYLHTWNVVGHVLGIRRELMADTMEQAAALFAQMQARGCERQVEPDPRPRLAQALMQTMEQVLPMRVLKPFPVLLTRHLCGRATTKNLGLGRRVSWPSGLLFALCMRVARGIDGLFRLVSPGFSIAGLITRAVGRRFMAEILMNQTRPLKLPQTLLHQVNTMMETWRKKPKAAR